MEDHIEAEINAIGEPVLLIKLERQINILKLISSALVVFLVLTGIFAYNLKRQMDLSYKKIADAIILVNKNLNNSIDDLESKIDDAEYRLTNVENNVDDIDGRLINLNI